MFRIAYFEPVQGLNVYGRELLPHLAQLDEIDVYTDADVSALDGVVSGNFPVRSFEEFETKRDGYDQLVFQVRNNPFHVPVYEALLAHGGVAVLHETKLVGILGAKTLSRGRRLSFLKEVLANEGAEACAHSAADLLLRRGSARASRYEMNRQAIRRSHGVIVHNRDAERQLRSRYPTLPVCIVRRGVPPPRPFDLTATKGALGLTGRFPIVASFGVINGRKRIGQALEAFAGITNEFPAAIYVLVGQPFEFDLEGIVARLGLAEHVLAPGRVDDETFNRYLAVTDIGINLRYPLEGETSSTALRIMSYGKPMLVTNAGSLAELPDSCTVKVDPGPDEVAQVRDALLELARRGGLRREIGSAALAHVRQHHTWERAAQTYHHFLEQLASLNGLHHSMR